MPTFTSRRPSNAAHNAGAAALLAYIRTIADAEGRFVISHAAMVAALGVRAHAIDFRLSLLRATRAIVREGKGRGRITGDDFVAPLAVGDVEPRRRASETVTAGGDYPTCREMGIEPTVHVLHNRTLGGETGVGDVVVTLARVPFLEGPLP